MREIVELSKSEYLELMGKLFDLDSIVNTEIDRLTKLNSSISRSELMSLVKFKDIRDELKSIKGVFNGI